ncbi:sulfatase-like hydrolase/transferase [Actinopolymorpha pittospori]
MTGGSAGPNVVVFFTDQQRWDTTGLHGNPLELTPNLDRLARQGTHLHHSFTCQPVCAPSRAVLQTGQYPTTTGVFRNGLRLPPTVPTLAHHFGDAGYATGYIGKWHLGDRASLGPVAPEQRGGYQYWLASNALEHTSDAYDTVMYDENGEPVSLPGYRVDALTDAAIRYVDAHQAEPFYLFVSYLEPHHQNHRDDYPAPHGYDERYRGRWVPPDLAALGGTAHSHLGGYFGMVKRLDEALGRLLDALESMGILDNTVVLFTSDHGNHFKTRNGEYKRSVHDASIRVPTVISGPGFQGGREIQELVSHIDLAPTLLDAAGLAIPEEMQGRSILPLVRGERSDWPDDLFVQVSESQVGRGVRTARWKYGVVSPDADPTTEPGADRYVETYLYDLRADPYELRNLAGLTSHRVVADRLRERLVRRMIQAGEAEPKIEPATPAEGKQLRVAVNEVGQ